MADTPKHVKIDVLMHPSVKQAIEDAHSVGVEEGKRLGRREMLDWLEDKYMGPDRPNRGTAEAGAILELTSEAAKFFRSKLNG